MNKHIERVAAAFNHAATTYQQHCDVQTSAGEHLIEKLLAIRKSFQHAADAGCGTGDTTTALAKSITYQSLTGFDIADDLLQLAREQHVGIDFIHDDFNRLNNYRAQFDLIFSNLALHWSHDLALTLRIMHASLADTGLFAFSLPLSGTFSEIEHHLSVQHFFSESDMAAMLIDAGFDIIGINQKIFYKNFHDTLSALRYLKLTGTNHVRERKHHSLHAKSFFSQLHIHQLTYQLGFFIVRKQHG